MSYNLVSLKQVIAKIYSDLQLSEVQQPVSDFISWGAEAIERIGAVGALEHKVAVTALKDYRARLPGDFKVLNQVAYSITPRGPWFIMPKSSGNFFAYKCQCKDSTGELVDIYSAMANMPFQEMVEFARKVVCVEHNEVWASNPFKHKELTYAEAAQLVNSDMFVRDTVRELAKGKWGAQYDLSKRDVSTPSFQIYGGNINCTHRFGYCAISYRALPLDDEGLPLLPDHISAIEAVYWFIVMKYYYPKWVNGEIRDAVYQHAQSSWNHYCRQSYGICQMPDQADMQGIKNMWLRLIPDLGADDRGFTDLYEKESLKITDYA